MENTVKEKILGMILLIAGLSVIGYSLSMGINIFVKAQDPPEIIKNFDVEKEFAQPSSKPSVAPLPKDLSQLKPEDLKNFNVGSLMSPETIKSIIPPELFTNTSRAMNLSVFSIFLWFLVTTGAKIASLGISLIKTNSNIKV